MNKFGEQKLEIEQNEFENQNSKQKDNDLQKYVLNLYEKWKLEPDQKGINMGTEIKYKSDIRSRNEVLKD